MSLIQFNLKAKLAFLKCIISSYSDFIGMGFYIFLKNIIQYPLCTCLIEKF